MCPVPETSNRANAEAAQWFARLNAQSISTEELSRFRVWRREPVNAQAYAELEHLWRLGDQLKTDPEIQSALAAAVARGRKPWWRRWGWLTGLLGGTVALAGFGALCLFGTFAGQAYQTAVGEQRSITLEDGTRVRLDTDSRLIARLSASERRIVLVRGQAFFDVVHSASRPLRVKVGDTVIRDLGTQFDVRKDNGQVRITVVEGSVQVATSGPASPVLSMRAGQQMIDGRARRAPYPVDPAKTTSWTSGRLIFDAMPLSAVTEEMNRYGRHKLILESGPTSDVRVSGAFDSTDTGAFVAAVKQLYDLNAKTQPNGDIILSASAAN